MGTRGLIWMVLVLIPVWGFSQPQGETYDVVITGGKVLDGSGNPWYYADVAIKDQRIAAIGNLSRARAQRRIDASGKYIVPGFIDIHSHADGPLYADRGLRADDLKRRAGPNLVSQGITLVVVNQDGRSPMELSVKDQIDELNSPGTGVNVAVLYGHGTLRRKVMGEDFRRTATAEEIKRMKQLLAEGMEQGAYGLSAGLEYVPGRWSDTRELIELVKW